MIQFKNYKVGDLYPKDEFCFIDSDKMKIIYFPEYLFGKNNYSHFQNLLSFYTFINPYKKNNIEYYKLIPKKYYKQMVLDLYYNFKRIPIVYTENLINQKIKESINRINRIKYLYKKIFNEPLVL